MASSLWPEWSSADFGLGGLSGASIARVATNTGTYTVLISDGNGSLSGSGTYRLDVSGIFGPVELNGPVRSGTTLITSGFGRGSNCTCILLTATNITTPSALWTSILTNNFGTNGVFTFTNLIDRNLVEYFRLLIP